MTDFHEAKTRDEIAGKSKKKRKSISMHDDVPVWYDCCSCEAEPYWAEMAEEEGEKKEENPKENKPDD